MAGDLEQISPRRHTHIPVTRELTRSTLFEAHSDTSTFLGDLRRLLERTRKFAGFHMDSYPVKATLRNTRGKGTYAGETHVLLPHETLHHFYKRSTPEQWRSGFLGAATERNGFSDFWKRDALTYPDHPVHSQPAGIVHYTCPVCIRDRPWQICVLAYPRPASLTINVFQTRS
jgi:hypothetical protein